jgi:excisionase family DNA binding protein
MSVGKSDLERLFRVELLTIQQVAEWAQVTPKTIYHWIKTEQIPVLKFSDRTYRIPARAIMEQLRRAGYEQLSESAPSD